MSEDTQRVTVINILAVSFTGSTWLNLMFGAHSKCFSVGEVDKLKKLGRAVCRLHGDDCELWSQFDLNNGENPFLQMSRLTGKRVLVINNSKRFREELKHPLIDRRYVMIFRDGRAFVASSQLKRPQSTWKLTRKWARETQRRYWWTVSDRAAKSQWVHFENLANDPEAMMRELCAGLDLTYEPGMLDYTRADPHFIGGSGGTTAVLAREKGLTTMHCQMHDNQIHEVDLTQPGQVLIDGGDKRVVDFTKYSKDHDSRMHIDKWTKHFPERELRRFRWMGGWLNWIMGYPPALKRESFPIRKRRFFRHVEG